MAQIGPSEILRFRIGLDGLTQRPVDLGDHAVCILAGSESAQLISGCGFYADQTDHARRAGASSALICLGPADVFERIDGCQQDLPGTVVAVPVPKTDFLLDGITHITAKMLLNALSTCVMVRLGRVIGNCMVAVVPSNLKLIDRAIRYIQTLTGLKYEDACYELFVSIEEVRSCMQKGQAYPPPVKMTVERVMG
jgi:hypothetical protein